MKTRAMKLRGFILVIPSVITLLDLRRPHEHPQGQELVILCQQMSLRRSVPKCTGYEVFVLDEEMSYL
jgi:hypothetical protein